MSGSGNWTVLRASVENTPQLLIRGQFSASGYEVGLTDLSHIWQTSATKRQIVQQASKIGSSIDPSQDNEQLKIFLSKIESAINGDDGTSLDINATKEDGSRLSIELSAKLPKPLPAFTWNLELGLLPRHETERLLISPLLRQASQLQHQIRQLVNELHDKDRVISKICDRLETSGNDLTTVFPGVSNIKTNRKKGQRDQLARHVKGLADFDDDAWKAQVACFDGNGEMSQEEINAVLSEMPLSDASVKASKCNPDWWRHFNKDVTRKADETSGSSSKSTQRESYGNSNGSLAGDSMQDDEFQTQDTPPHLKQRNLLEKTALTNSDSLNISAEPEAANNRAATQENDDSTTEDEDDLDAAPRRSQSDRAPTSGISQQTRSPRKLGKLGGRQVNELTPEIPEAPSVDKSPEPKPASRLGKIGGKAKAIKASQVSPESDAEVASTPARSTEVGSIGGDRAAHEARITNEDVAMESVPIEEEQRAARSSAKAESPPQRENSEERADRKRDQLKRELEEKAKAPVKKKRKF